MNSVLWENRWKLESVLIDLNVLNGKNGPMAGVFVSVGMIIPFASHTRANLAHLVCGCSEHGCVDLTTKHLRMMTVRKKFLKGRGIGRHFRKVYSPAIFLENF